MSLPEHPHPISATTRYCAVYGHPIKHSASPAMQNAGIASLGLNWRYLAFDVHPDNLRRAIDGAKAMGYLGLNLTVPHKLLAYEMVDELDESGRLWGAVNTIRFEGKGTDDEWKPLAQLEPDFDGEIRTRGFNTDADAITQAIREDLKLKLAGATVLLLGAGGAGRVAALKLASEGVKELHLVNRTESKAEEIAVAVRERFPEVNVSVGYPQGAATADLLMNATSLGLKADDVLPLDITKFPVRNAAHVYDMIYRPAETPLLKLAKGAGCKTANGLGMLLHQGVKALEIWAGKAPPAAVMREALEVNVYG